jgi:hypothetical protein
MDSLRNNFSLPDGVPLSRIDFTRYIPPSDHPYYEYMTCEWVGVSRYCLVTTDFIEMLAKGGLPDIVEYPLSGIVEGVVFFVGQYHLQILGYNEFHHAYILERLN